MTTRSNSVRGNNNLKSLALRLLLPAAVLALAPVHVFGIAFRIPNQDAEAIARGNAFVATADNPSAIYYNPAGISQLKGNNIQVGDLNYLGINTFFDSSAGDHLDSKFEVIPVPQIYYAYAPEECAFAFGLGVYAPFGLGVEWPKEPFMRPYAIESRLQYITVNPVVSWKPHRTFSVAVGPTINQSKIKFTRGLATPTDYFKFEGDDVSLGFNAGMLWQPHEQWSFGANYRSASTMHYSGLSHYDPGVAIPSAKTTASIPFPQIASAGVSYRPTPKWNIEVNVDYTDWNTMNTVVLNGTSDLGFPIDLPLQLDWHESWFYEVGVTRYFENGWFASAGYFYCSETTSDKTFTPAIPDTILHVGSVGFGHKGERWNWAVAAQLIAGPERSITTSPAAPAGRYQLVIPTLTFSAGYKF